jgi:hypothetical protein
MYISNRSKSQPITLPDILKVAERHGAKLKRCGKEWIGPCPRCGGTDRFAVNTAKQLFNCRGGGLGGDVIEMVRYLNGASYRRAIEILTGSNIPLPSPPPSPETFNEADDREHIRRAMEIFREAVDLRDTPAETYLARRGIPLDKLSDRIGDALRWHPSCPWETGRHGAMVGLYTDPLTAEPMAIHRTFITPAGEKVGRRYLGPKGGCVIRLWPDIGQTLVVGEGIETVLSAATNLTYRGAPLSPAWAAGDAGNIKSLPVLPGIEKLILLVDHDESGCGQRVTAECARRWEAAGRKVIRLMPRKLGNDFINVALK